jgi:hypothetical protein
MLYITDCVSLEGSIIYFPGINLRVFVLPILLHENWKGGRVLFFKRISSSDGKILLACVGITLVTCISSDLLAKYLLKCQSQEE